MSPPLVFPGPRSIVQMEARISYVYIFKKIINQVKLLCKIPILSS